MISTNDTLNFIMVIIIQDSFQVDVQIGSISHNYRLQFAHPAQKEPKLPQKRARVTPKEGTPGTKPGGRVFK